jgi:hypothetical protein
LNIMYWHGLLVLNDRKSMFIYTFVLGFITCL